MWKNKKTFSFYEDNKTYKSYIYSNTTTGIEINLFEMLKDKKRIYLVTLYNTKQKQVYGYEDSSSFQFLFKKSFDKNQFITEVKKYVDKNNPKDLSFVPIFYKKFGNFSISKDDLEKNFYDIINLWII